MVCFFGAVSSGQEEIRVTTVDRGAGRGRNTGGLIMIVRPRIVKAHLKIKDHRTRGIHIFVWNTTSLGNKQRRGGGEDGRSRHQFSTKDHQGPSEKKGPVYEYYYFVFSWNTKTLDLCLSFEPLSVVRRRSAKQR